MPSENTIQRKEAQRLAREDGKELGKLPTAERAAYLAKAKATLEARVSMTMRDDWLSPGLVTLLELSEAFSKNAALRSVCSDGNSSVESVARDLALTVMDYVKAKAGDAHGEQGDGK